MYTHLSTIGSLSSRLITFVTAGTKVLLLSANTIQFLKSKEEGQSEHDLNPGFVHDTQYLASELMNGIALFRTMY